MQVEKVAQHIISWLSAYAEKAHAKGFVVGVSGGIDSALTSTLAAKTGLPTLVVQMPIHQAENQVSRAARHIDKLQQRFNNVQTEETNLTQVYDDLRQTFGESTEPTQEMALVNTRARLRMTTLYYHAALHGYLVAGTGNKVEDFGVGFYTKYGDGGVDLSPIADLLKSEVFKLAKHLSVINDILDAPPTDGLWGDDRTDEDQIGATYPELEWAMEQISLGKTAHDFTQREREVLEIYQRLNTQNQHKMQPIPVCEIPKEFK